MAPFTRFQKLTPEKRAAILDSAATEFVKYGPADASVNRVIARAGLGKSSFYHFFEGKDDLYGAVAQRALDELLVAIMPDNMPATTDAYWRALEDICAGFLRRQRKDPILAQQSFGGAGTGAGHVNRVARDLLAQQTRQWLDALIVQGQSLGAVRSDIDQALLLDAAFGMLAGSDRWYAATCDQTDEAATMAAARRIVELLKDLVGRRAD